MTKFNKGDLVAAVKDIGGFAREFVPRGSEGVVDHASNTLGNFCFDVVLTYRRLELPRRVEDST